MSLFLAYVCIFYMFNFCHGEEPDSIRTKRSNTICAPIDLIIVIDESGSVGLNNYKTMLSFVSDLLRNFHIGPYDTLVGMVAFSSYPRRVFNFDTYRTREEIQSAVRSTAYNDGGTNIPDALGETLDMFVNNHAQRHNAEKLVLFLTDGMSYNYQETLSKANLLHKVGVKMFAIGIGSNLNLIELECIASKPHSTFLIKATQFSDLQSKIAPLVKGLCFAKCNNPGYLTNGDVWGSDFTEGYSVRFTCKLNYTLIGSSSQTCQSNGRWSNSKPRCAFMKSCKADTCKNGGQCKNIPDSYQCICTQGFMGTNCEQDINECLPKSPCIHGSCVNTFGSYHCKCAAGWRDPLCDTDIDECRVPVCCHGGTCTNNIGSFSCSCPSGFTGNTCSQDMDDCDTNRCKNGGVCYNRPGSYMCHCKNGTFGDDCGNDVDECVSAPCANGGKCHNVPGGYRCECDDRLGYAGKNCDEDIDECNVTLPCLNNGTCKNIDGSFICACQSDWTGQFCEKEKDVCYANPCLNNGTCNVINNTYVCYCPAGYFGQNCQDDVNECENSACFNNATCRNTPGSFVCECTSEFQGPLCTEDVNECNSSPCEYNGMCINKLGGFSCICKTGKKGPLCQNDGCEGIVCENNGTCIPMGDTYRCQCTSQFFGENCTEDVDECTYSPCKNSSTCNNIFGGFQCSCNNSSDNCSNDAIRDVCSSNPCQHEGLCLVNKTSYVCECKQGWSGFNCDIEMDGCINTTCHNNGTCQSILGMYQCVCPLGYKGLNCNEDVDECEMEPCWNNSTCINVNGSFYCNCSAGYSGQQCQNVMSKCTHGPCHNGATCVDEPGSFLCRCTESWTGNTCEEDANECSLDSLCQHNGTCINTNGSYHCNCAAGFTGTHCHLDYDECESQPCQHNGICINMVSQYACVCQSGFNGSNCEIDLDECNTFPCQNNGTCKNLDGGGFSCLCKAGWTGVACETDEDECALERNYCSPNRSCTNNMGSFKCDCDQFYTGQHCEEDVDECTQTPNICKNGGTCENFCGGFRCHCTSGNTGTYCDGNIDECLDGPCKNDGNCTDTPGSFRCDCTSNWTGSLCETDVPECLTSPCVYGDCNEFDGGFNCSCWTGFHGNLCQDDINECLSSACKNAGFCNNTIGSFHCDCTDNWDVPFCEIDLCKTQAARLIFIVDTSYSTTATVIAQQKQFIKDIVTKVSISDDKFNVAVITYGTVARVDIDFNSYENKSVLLDQIESISFVNGTTNIDKACTMVKQLLRSVTNIPQFVFLFTDGMPSNLRSSRTEVEELRTHMYSLNSLNELLIVAFGDDVRHEGLGQLSGNEQYLDVYNHVTFDSLHRVYRKLVDIRCTACKSRQDVDVIFLVDTSTAQPFNKFTAGTSIIHGLLQLFTSSVSLGHDKVQIGAVFFSDKPSAIIYLNYTHNIPDFGSSFSEYLVQDKHNSSSNVADALRFVESVMFSKYHGARESSRKYVIYINSGFDANVTETILESQKLTKNNIFVISIGVGDSYKDDDVIHTASSAFHAYLTENTADENWKLTETEMNFIKNGMSFLACTDRVNP